MKRAMRKLIGHREMTLGELHLANKYQKIEKYRKLNTFDKLLHKIFEIA